MPRRAVVVGGGLGGLAAGVALARGGARVTLLEKESRPGGYAVSYTRGGFTFDLALHVTAAGGEGQEFRRLADRLGLEVDFLRIADGFGVLLGDDLHLLPNGWDELFASLADGFPAEREGLQRLRRRLEEWGPVFAGLFDPEVSRSQAIPPFLPRLPAFLRLARTPASAFLREHVRDPRLAALVFAPCTFLGTPADGLPAVNLVMMLHYLFRLGMYTVAGGGQALSGALARRLTGLGGEILTSTEADAILLRDGRAAGVRTAAGREFEADGVVAAVNLPQTVGRLLADAPLPSSYRRRAAALEPSLSVLALNLGLDCDPRDLGIARHITLLFPDEDIDGCLRRQRAGGPFEGFSVTAHGVTEPGARAPSPRGISVVGGADPGRWLDLEGQDYRWAREEAEAAMLAAVERRFPGAAAHATVRSLATPRTMWRYTGNPGGAIMGFSCPPGAHRGLRIASRPPVGGLVTAGAWTDALGGFLGSVKAGERAAGILERWWRRNG